MKRPSILFVNRVYPSQQGATGRLLQELAQTFAKEGWHVTILATGETSTTERDGLIQVIRVKTKQNPKSAFDYATILFKLYNKLRTITPPHVLVTMTDPPMTILAGHRYAQKNTCKHIHWCQDLYPDLLPALGYNIPSFAMNWLKALSTEALKSCDKIITIGRCMARRLSQDKIEPTKITVIPNWPNTSLKTQKKTTNSAQSQQTARHEQALNFSRPYDKLLKQDPKFRVLYAGTIGKAHPMKTILEAAQELNEAAPQIEFVFVGDEKRQEALAKERSKRGLTNIRFLPHQPENKLHDIMESGDLHLISMNDKAAGSLVPCKLYSALAVARPCIFIGPEQCEAAKIIQDFKAGTIISQGDSITLATTIKSYLEDSDLWFQAHDGARKAGEIFIPEESINAWIERAWTIIHDEFKQPTQNKKAS